MATDHLFHRVARSAGLILPSAGAGEGLVDPGRRALLRGGVAAGGLAAVSAVTTWAQPARAEISITLDRANFQPLPIAIADFGGDPDLGARIAGVVAADLKRCGYFAPLDRGAFPPGPIEFDAVPAFQAWQAINAQALATGRVSRDGGRLRTAYRLWDVSAGQQMTGQQFVTDANNWRRVGHIIADSILSRLTGLKGMFDARIVYVDESGPRDQRRKRLAIMDTDGANMRFLTRGEESVVTPRFAPNSAEVTYMSQARGSQPRVQVLNIDTGQRQMVGNFPDMTSSPRFSPNGQSIVLSLQQGGNANIYLMNLGSRTTTRLTSASAIDTSPSFSPDGARIAFESDRGGGQQIYVMSGSGGDAQRISFGEGRYSQPVWSPRGDFIAFTRQKAGMFAIGVMKPDGSGERILTEGFHNEGPTWAPNGQFLMFFRDPGGEGGSKLYMTDITGRVEAPIRTSGFASDPGWSQVLSEMR
ncbi:Tol-Pal system beta propeller repeat protein TolB [Camelimonas lactis]|uniref:Tol-Pal system protein TolB n=1 Tax=Camelimonas lactis TaxID=659006 RepID=A0A4R2GR31_9HYPH|nr:Tol-Pal system beta propeller repeat protein TolB [Camelimonas lactis]TCO12463.1 TolB protein [Camelimonas lactis]